MASPSRRSLKDLDDNNSHPQEDEEGGGDWLELALGFGNNKRCKKSSKAVTVEVLSAIPSSSSILQFDNSKQTGLGVGLDLEESRQKLGFGNEVVCRDTKYQDHHYYCDDDDDDGRFAVEKQISMGVIPHNNNDYYNKDCSSTTRSRPHAATGFWFALRFSSNSKDGGVRLPQLAKPFIRVKDGSVGILMVKKYLVTKLGLSNQAEIDITCLGQKLIHTQTLKQVRDSIWIPKMMEHSFESTTSSGGSSSTVLFGNLHDRFDNHHLMSLHYQKSFLPSI